MGVSIASALLIAIASYLACGLCFAAFTLAGGLARLDAAAAKAPWTAKLLWLPGLAALWPYMFAQMRSVRGVHP